MIQSRFKHIYETYFERCFLFAKSYVHDDLAAEDISSEALIKLWEVSKNQELETPEYLLFTILKHKSLDFLRQEAARQNALANLEYLGRRELDIRISTLEAANPERIFASDIQQIIQTTLDNMPERTKKVFEMSRYRHLSKAEIADELDITIKGVDYHISKALKSLRENLKDYYPIFIFFFF